VSQQLSEVVATDEVLFIDPGRIDPDPEQPRLEPDDELSASVRAVGVLHAVTVRPHPDPDRADRWMLVDGERRWRAAMAAGVAEIPIRIRYDLEDRADRLVFQLTSNTGKPLSPLEEALAWKAILDDTHWSQAKLAEVFGIPRSSVGDRIRLAELPEAWQALLRTGHITVSQAVEVCRFRKLPAHVQARAIAKLQAWTWWDKERGASAETVQAFAAHIGACYIECCYPLDERALTHEQVRLPKEALAQHDTECTCGRVKLARWAGQPAYEYCGDPEWWQPRVTAAQKAAEATRAAAEAKKAARRKSTLEIPKGTPSVSWAGYNKPPKGHIVLTDGKRWATDRWGRLAFDPDDLTLEEGKLVRWSSPYGREGVMTTDVAAVKAAHAQWAARWALRLEELQRECATRVREVAARFRFAPEQGEAVRQLLLLCLENGNAYATSTVAEHVVYLAGLEGLAVPDDVTQALRDGNVGRAKNAAVWLAEVPAEAIAVIAAGVIAMRVEELDDPEVELEAEQARALSEIAMRKTPWADAPAVARCVRCQAPHAEEELVDGLCAKCEANAEEEVEADDAADEPLPAED
jgi:ParB/RepB/Spo0J family partition protein